MSFGHEPCASRGDCYHVRAGRKNVESGHLNRIRSKEASRRGGLRSMKLYGNPLTIESCAKGGQIQGRRNVESGHLAQIQKSAADSRRIYKTRKEARIADVLRSRLWQALKNRTLRAGSAVRDLGCSIPEFKKYIAEIFEPGMSWENWGEWHLDHIKPLASFDLTDRKQFLEACHYTNYQPLWAVENVKKGGAAR